MQKNYEIIDHTADIGVRVSAGSLKELFANAGLAVFRISCRKQFTKEKKHNPVIIKQKADTLEELFIGWLNELISVSGAKSLIFHKIEIEKLEGCSLQARCVASSVVNYKVNIEIKAATYHNLSIKQVDAGWQAEVIFDV